MDCAEITAPLDSFTPRMDSHAMGAAPATRGIVATMTPIKTVILMSTPVSCGAVERIIRTRAAVASRMNADHRLEITCALPT
jgi:hypothetical protein